MAGTYLQEQYERHMQYAAAAMERQRQAAMNQASQFMPPTQQWLKDCLSEPPQKPKPANPNKVLLLC